MEQNDFKKPQKNNVTLKDQFICHLVYEHDFIQQFNDMIVDFFDVREHLFIVYGKHAWEESKKYHLKNSYYIDSFDDRCFLEWVEKSVQIIVHCLYTPAVTEFLFTHHSLLNKVNWKLWGGDLYLYRQVGSISNSESNEARRKSVIKEIAYITSPVEEEVEHAIVVYNSKALYKFAFYPQAKDFREFRLNGGSPKNQTINILVGNSGYPTNNHFQAFDNLSKFQNGPIKIYCPLSYGDKPYTEEVCAKGKQIFGDKFVPLLNFIPFDEYVNLLNAMDVVVMNHDRQQGMGNILTSLYLGKKVYMQPDITSYKYLSRCGITLFDINEIEKNDFNHFITFSDQCQKIHSEIIDSLYSKENCVKSWQAIFSEAITRKKESTRRFYLINFHYKDFYSSTIRNPSLGPAYILQHLSDNGVATKLHELSFNGDIDYLLKDIKIFSPDLIGCSFMTYYYKKTYKYIEALKRLGIPIVCGGAHVNSKGSKVMDELDADFLIKGEGEKSLLSLLQNIKDPEAFPNVPGLIYRKNGTIVENDAEIIDIEELRFPKYRNYDLNQYADGRILIQTSRGCPYQCTFCQQASLLGKKWRARSPQNIIHELEYWGALGKTSVVFGDDNLTLDRKRIRKLCELMNKSKYRFQIETAGVRIDNVDYDTLKMMRDVGIHYLSYGIESGSDRVLKEIRKGITLNQVHQTLEMSCKLGFDIKLYFIINHRTETYKEAQQSFSLSRQYPINLARFTNLCPFPGTYDYEWILKHGKLLYPPEEYLNNPNDFIDKPIYDGPGMAMEERMQVIEDAKAELVRPKNLIPPLFLNRAENKGSKAMNSVWINKKDIRKTPQRVLFVNHSLYPYEISGTPLSTLNHALGLSRRGFQVAVLIPSFSVKEGYTKGKVSGFTLYQIPALKKEEAYLSAAGEHRLEGYWNAVNGMIDDFSPDLVQINDYVYMPAEIVEVFSARGCIVVRNVCNFEELCHRDYPVISDGLEGRLCPGPAGPSMCTECFLARQGTSPQGRVNQHFLQDIGERVGHRFEYIRWLYRNAVDKAIFTSDPFRTFFTRFVPISEEKTALVPRGFEFDFERREKIQSRADGKIHFAFIGNLMFSKGIDVVLRAFEAICERDDFALHLYGEIVDHEYTPYLKRLEALYPGKIRHHGSYRKEALPEIYRKIDMCLVPSYFDTYNRVLREALYLGIPVIATDFFGAFIVEDGRNGFRVEVGDAGALARKMTEILRQPAMLENLFRGAAKTQIPTLDEEVEQLIENYNDLSRPQQQKQKANRVLSPRGKAIFLPERRIRPIAIYLPQFHPIPENDQWWGKGFTEWTNVAKARPIYKDHYQPRLPADLGFYDLRLPEVRKSQADLAREYGFHGFCYYHYWFNGRRLLERPFEEVLKSGEPDFPFCLCWANENWTRAWDGHEREILLRQEYSEEDDLHHIRWLAKAFKDNRYIRIDGKPLMLIYRVKNLPDAAKTAEIWREEARRLGIGELYLCRFEIFPEDHQDASNIGFDASVEFQPDWMHLGKPLLSPVYKDHAVYRYEDIVERMLSKGEAPYKRFPCVTPSWDNSPRRKSGAVIFTESTPELYERWLRKSLEGFKPFSPEENLIFVNAWNEWAEGNHLEPDQKFGRGYLEATRRALWTSDYNLDAIPPSSIYEDCLRLIDLGREEDAIQGFKKLLKIDPNQAAYYDQLGILYSRKENIEKAQQHLEAAVELDPENPEYRKNLDTLRDSKKEGVFKTSEGERFRRFFAKPSNGDEKRRIGGRKVSIILPVFNRLNLTQHCLTSIFQNTPDSNYELIIVDAGSTDGTAEYLQRLKTAPVKTIFQKQPIGFVEACHAGAETASGDYLVFLKNVPEVQPGWLGSLLQFAESTPDCGAVGPKLISPSEKLQEAGGVIFSDGTVWHYGQGMNPADPKFNFVREADYCSSAALMVRKDLWTEIGGFDRRYEPACYEDIDLCLEIQKRRFKVYYNPQSVVIRHEKQAAETDPYPDDQKYQAANRAKFVGKWGEGFLKRFPSNPMSLFKTSNKQSLKKILVTVPSLPFLGRPAESLRLVQLLKVLRQMDCHITFIAGHGSVEERYRPFLEKMGIEVYAWDVDAMKAAGYQVDHIDPIDYPLFFQERKFDYAIIEFWYLAAYYLPLLRQHSPSTQIIIDTIDVHFEHEMQEAEFRRDPELKRKILSNKDREIAIYNRADRLWVVTEHDKKTIEPACGRIPIDVIPNIHEKKDFVRRFEDTSGLLFAGNFNHPAHRDAARFFCKEIFPLILASVPDIQFYLAGNEPPEEVKALASDRIIITGHAEDLSPCFRKARIFINPLCQRAGMRGKIGEALSWGLPVVTTLVGTEGLELINGSEALVADRAEEFAENIVNLYNDQELWNRLSLNGKKKAEIHWTPEAMRARLKSVFEPSGIARRKKLVSIIIPVRNQLEYTQKCLDSVFKYTDHPYEVIVVDNGSTDGTVDYLREITEGRVEVGGYRFKVGIEGEVVWKEGSLQKMEAEKRSRTEKKKKRKKMEKEGRELACRSFRVIRNRSNMGFAAGNNQGIREAKGDYLLLMNNDLVVTPGWLSRLIAVAEKRPEIGMVGPMSNYVSGPQLVKEVDYDQQALVGLNRFSEYVARRFQAKARPFWRVVAFCMLIKREVIEKIGGFDPRFGLGNFEDDDFSLRATLAGFESWIVEDCFVHHFGSRTFAGEKMDYRGSLERNWSLFKRKWEIPEEVAYGASYDLSRIIKKEFGSMRHYWPLSPEEYSLSRGEFLFNEGDLEGAKIIFNGLFEQGSENIELINNLGVVAFSGGKIEEAISCFRNVLAKKAEHVDAIENLGNCFLFRKDYQAALPWFKKAMELRPGETRILNEVANCYVQLGDLQAAESSYVRSLEIDDRQTLVKEILEELKRIDVRITERRVSI